MCLATDREALLTFFAFPAEHWIHLRITNVIESPFATVHLRQRGTKGAGSRTKGLLMAYKLLDMAQRRWRRLNAAHLLPLVRAGVVFIDGVQQEPNTEEDRKEAAWITLIADPQLLTISLRRATNGALLEPSDGSPIISDGVQRAHIMAAP